MVWHFSTLLLVARRWLSSLTVVFFESLSWLSYAFSPIFFGYIWATSRENLSSGFATSYDSNQPAQLMRLARLARRWLSSLTVVFFEILSWLSYAFSPIFFGYIWATSRENMSSEFATSYDSNRPAQLMRLARLARRWLSSLTVVFFEILSWLSYAFSPIFFDYIWATSRENLYSEFATSYDSNRPAKLMRLARLARRWLSSLTVVFFEILSWLSYVFSPIFFSYIWARSRENLLRGLRPVTTQTGLLSWWD